ACWGIGCASRNHGGPQKGGNPIFFNAQVAPKSDASADRFGDYQRGLRRLYSTSWSARIRNGPGISMPSCFAVLRLSINQLLLGSSTGRSLGFAPLRMAST